MNEIWLCIREQYLKISPVNKKQKLQFEGEVYDFLAANSVKQNW